MFKILTVIVALCFSGTAWADGKELAKEPTEAKQFVAALGDSVVDIFDKQTAPSEREKSLTSLFDKSIDSAWMGKFVVGKYWRQIEEPKKEKFLLLYKDFLFVNYLPHFRNYSGEKQQVLDVVDEGDGDYLVRTQIMRPGKDAPVRVDYRVHRAEGKSNFLIFDIVTEGVSVMTTHRSDFGSVISQEGVDGLIKRLETKVQAVKSSKQK